MTKDDINTLGVLSRIDIQPEQCKPISERLDAVLEMIDQLQGTDTTGVAPMSHPMDAVQTLRQDQVTADDHREILMKNAPNSEDGLFLVPKVID